MASAGFLLDADGVVMNQFEYRDDADEDIPDIFMKCVQSSYGEPVFQFGEWTFLYVRRSGIYFMCVTKVNADAAILLRFLQDLAGIGDVFVGMEADAIVGSYDRIHALLDEVMDYG